ncbi:MULTISPECIES: hypothetical protein [unclassified Serratia (in: enterobacteria)]|nr:MULTISPECIES: hypothetical protein [unclassified Serratia (in: enterobacteria)]
MNSRRMSIGYRASQMCCGVSIKAVPASPPVTEREDNEPNSHWGD